MRGGWKPIDEMRHMTKRTLRVDGREIVTGRAQYTGDVRPDGMLYARLMSCPHPNCTVLSVDTSEAEALPGVEAVWHALEWDKWYSLSFSRVVYAGDHVAAVAATTPAIAEDAIRLIRAEYDVYPFSVRLQDSLRAATPRVRSERPNVTKYAVNEQSGDVEASLGAADALIDEEYATQVQEHACLETDTATCLWTDDGDLIAWVAAQSVFIRRYELARVTDMEPTRVRVLCDYVGGGFGGKYGGGSKFPPIVAVLAKRAGRPVQCRMRRRQHSATAGNRPSSVQRMRAGATRDGSIVALDVDAHGTGGFQYGAELPVPYVYRPESWRSRVSHVYTNSQGGGPIRGQRAVQASWGIERAIDDLADRMGIDPLAMRIRNDPRPRRHDQLRRLATEIGWGRRAGLRANGPLRRGLGMASAEVDYAGNSAHCAVEITSDGGVNVLCGADELGTGMRTAIAVIAAEELGLPVEAVTPRIGDTRLPFTHGSGRSTGTSSVGPAVKVAARAALDEVFARIGAGMRAAPTRLSAADGYIHIRGLAGRAMAWKDACQLIGPHPVYAHGITDRELASRGVMGCCGAEVEVDVETGRVRVVRMVSIQDCGLVVNRLAVEAQILSGMVMGLSFALFEDRIMDPLQGLQLNGDLEFYKIATAMDVGELVPIVWMERDSLDEGIKGVGQAPMIPVAAAIGNAVKNALGVGVNRLPMTPRRVLEALHGV
ncbi:xanthine dehydrogenase family protein molybdopterin-binding subunit [Candidatus Poribacteria bacterium]|jgi:xanthine dehydrogenase YagR molybdenum-binding subunit|nr:xanthine dehydrogenase family protein molybdopterin-binding subunit [Candidatus Poribacteria bacterium]